MIWYYDWLEKYSKAQQAILSHLSELLLSYPELRMERKYQMPFYYRKSWIAYLNPLKDGGVELCFCRAFKMEDSLNVLEKKNRTMVYGITFQSLSDWPEETIHELLADAIAVDDQFALNKER